MFTFTPRFVNKMWILLIHLVSEASLYHFPFVFLQRGMLFQLSYTIFARNNCRPGSPDEESYHLSNAPVSEISAPSSESGTKSLSTSSSSSEVEIRHSLKAAKDFAAQGKYDKATKVYQHIISLHPKHPDVLTAYGQLLEEGYDDIVEVRSSLT